MAETIENLVVRVAMDGTGFQNGVSKINRKLKLVQSEFKVAEQQVGKFGSATDRLKIKSDSLTKQITIQKDKVEALRRALQQSIDKKGADATATQNLAIKTNKAKEALAKMENQLVDTNDQIKKEGSALHRLNQRLEKSGQKMRDFGDNTGQAGQALTIGLTAPIAGIGFTATKAAIDFETAFTGVKKTVNATEAEYEQLEKGIRDMAKEIPSSTEEIAKVAEAAGQLGIKKGAILDFTRTMIDLGNSTNLAADQGATALARLANITQMPQDEFDRLGSTIVGLGNNLATTEAEIAEMSLRIAGAGHQIGLTEPQILGFAGALSSVGINAEAGGSAISRVMINIASAVQKGGDKLKTFAKVSGESVEDFRKSFKKDAADAILDFIEGLGDMQEEGKNTFGVLDDLGLSEIRVRDALLRASGAGDAFREALELGNKAWEENTALTNEATKRYDTAASQLKIFWNRIKDVGIELGQALVPALLDAVDAAEPVIDFTRDMADAFADLSKPTQRIILGIAGVTAAMGPLMLVTGPLISGIGSLALAMTTAGVSMTAVLGPIGLVVGGLTALGVAAFAFAGAQNDLNEVSLETYESMKKQHDQMAKLIPEFEKLRNKSNLTNDEFSRYLDLQERIKTATDPQAIKSLKDEVEKLRKKSGLSNDQLNRMVDLNKTITEKMPKATGTITEQGNRVADTTEALKRYNEELAEASIRELSKERNKALLNQKALQQQINKLQDRYNRGTQIEAELKKLLNGYTKSIARTKISEYETDIKQLNTQIQSGKYTAEEVKQMKIKLENERVLLTALKGGKNELLKQLIHYQDQNDEIDKQIEKKQAEINKLDVITRKLKTQLLVSAGIDREIAQQNVKKGTAIDLVNEQINKLKDERAQIIANAKKQGGMNQVHREAVQKIDKQIDKLRGVRSEIGNITDEGRDMNSVLGKDIFKDLVIKRRYTGPRPMGGPYKYAYAEGTNFHPGGYALVGEEGPEIVNLPRGAQVIPNDESERLLQSLRSLPHFADGGEMLRQGLALVGERGRELVRMPQGQATSTAPQRGGDVNQYITINSPQPTSPSENARKYKQAGQYLAMEWNMR